MLRNRTPCPLKYTVRRLRFVLEERGRERQEGKAGWLTKVSPDWLHVGKKDKDRRRVFVRAPADECSVTYLFTHDKCSLAGTSLVR